MKKIKPIDKTGNIGIFFGSFNPITIGHIHVAENSILAEKDGVKLDEVWFAVSPHNPHKWKKGVLASELHRWNMVNESVKELNNPKIKATNIEFFQEQKPSYTHHTLQELKSDNPDATIFIVCGTDTHLKIQVWRSGKWIHKNFKFWVFPRGDKHEEVENKTLHNNSFYLDSLEKSNMSSTLIRNAIKQNKSIVDMTPQSVVDYIKQNNVYDFLTSNEVNFCDMPNEELMKILDFCEVMEVINNSEMEQKFIGEKCVEKKWSWYDTITVMPTKIKFSKSPYPSLVIMTSSKYSKLKKNLI